MGGTVAPLELDAVIVGAGYGGVYLLRNLRKHGYKVKVIESGGGLGGVWWWNTYPGARVDTGVPLYEYTDKELWEGWTWKEYFPGRDEICDYFKYVDKKWDLSKDIKFNTTVTSAEFDADQDEWTIHTDKGFASKKHIPNLKGFDTFEGTCYHTSLWPQNGVDFRGKRVGIIGTGASGVQVIQETGPLVQHLTVFQRTPNMALPMGQRQLTKESQEIAKKGYPETHKYAKQTFAGWDYDSFPKEAADDPPETRLELWELLWEKQGFYPWIGNYTDLLFNEDTNNQFFAFWRDKTRQRITKRNPELLETLAPTAAPHPFGTKRPSLEQSYYEVYNQNNVELVDVKKSPIVSITPKGLKTVEKDYQFDILVLATGFDAVTGGLTKIDIHGTDGITLKDKWKRGSWTHLGMATAGFPNMLFMYGPQSPTAFAIGPTISEVQGGWIVTLLESMKLRNQRRIDVIPTAEASWTKMVNDLANASLFPKADSWYMGANIPGKARESLNYIGGLPNYQKIINECIESGYAGFVLK
ncbi:hypothetical protein LTR20_006738 [Exophiala xenobiotica]|nr:hypothetical protein LTR40_002282 [Exophiala xenobiotica]KAK5371339.1 hypothetical protein LTS13_006716 [Exophiala xenobiotica]KAK5413180.1 hypothetical protein LTR90_007302 [Exophiala xenobiotica]KAK5461814.1 hypothetical protein LTR20_006738 [Exophiala xenobiotica]KAK5482498.1 hypothetical protein LTR26_006832 [Exophiala xenobiotica]